MIQASYVRGPLLPVADLAFARCILTEYEPRDAAQREARARMLAFVQAHPGEAHRRTCRPGHLTASALLLDDARERALLTFHRKLGRWLQLGGHCDGDANLARVALREVIEESGIADVRIDPRPVDLDIHTIPARPGEPEHLHLDTRFLARAAAGSRASANDESLELRWFAPEELAQIETDASVVRLFALAFGPSARGGSTGGGRAGSAT